MATPTGERYFFLHLQKTGGTALFKRLHRQFGRARIYPNASDGDVTTVAPQLSVERLLERWEVRGPQVQIVAGHFPLCTTELLGGSFRTLTIVRHPVERTLSYLRHHQDLTPADRSKDLEEVYEDPFRFKGLIHNHMTKMLALRLDDMTAGMLTEAHMDDEDRRRACDALDQMDLVGIQEDFNGFWEVLVDEWGWRLGPPIFANRTTPRPVSDAFRQRIAADNDLDMAVYEHALAAWRRRRASATTGIV
ncbi:MAG: sulfotransferase family 2 domain-containing protein [Acidimicrobiia bacterium]|nr:sulfotransferase family 2 domain-containing protein [Acidimicrobiia bacterium]